MKGVAMRSLFYALAATLFATFVSAAQYDMDSIDIADDVSLILQGMELPGARIDVHLMRYNNPNDPAGYYWSLGTIESAPDTYSVYKETDIPYVRENADPRNVLDIYYPEGVTGAKVILFVPGGAWRQGDKSKYDELGRTLAGYYGYTTVVMNYRLSNEEDGAAVHPDHVEDVAAAFGWVKRNISHYGDPSRIYLFGQSAGAHLVSLLALDETYLRHEGYSAADIKGVISMSASYDLYALVEFPTNTLGLSAEEVLMYKAVFQDAFGGWSAEVLDPASPEDYVSATQPPFLVIYADYDMPGFGQEAQTFAATVRGLTPSAPFVQIEHLTISDFSDATWTAAAQLAAEEPAFRDYVGHYAEVVAINTTEPDSRSTTLVVDFIEAH
jgi:acetyl esterase/lipase